MKAEKLQRTGSFKIRGAVNRVATLDEAERGAGVVTASAGNHGQAVAWAAREAGIGATIFMPQDAPMAKVDAKRSYGAAVRLAFVCFALDRGRVFLEGAPTLGSSTLWLEAAVAVAGGDPGRAAEILTGIGARPDEAFARICAAEALVASGRRPEADAQLAAALAICREIGADAWTRRAEALLAAAG